MGQKTQQGPGPEASGPGFVEYRVQAKTHDTDVNDEARGHLAVLSHRAIHSVTVIL